jgi:O-antigen ligase
MRLATGLYLTGVFLFILFTDALVGISGQSLAYGPLSAALLVLVLLGATRGPRNFLQQWYVENPMSLAGLLFLLGLAISLPNARDVGLAAKDFVRWTFIWLVFAPATRAICRTEKQCALVTRSAVIAIIALGAVALGDLLTGGGVTPRLIGRAGVNEAGRYTGKWSARCVWAVGALAIFGAMLLTGTRITLLTSAVACIVILGAQRRWWVAGIAGVVIIVGALLPTSALTDAAPTLARVHETITSTGSGERSLQRRFLIWSLAAEMIAESPVFGHGGSQLRFAQHAGFKRAHNAWLDAWLDGGLPAAVAMLLVTALVLKRTVETLRGRIPQYRHPTHVALVAASCAVLLGWTVRAGIGGRIDWLPIFLLYGICWDVGRGQRIGNRE